MAHPLVLPLSQCHDAPLVGGKAAGLARLLAQGLAVPDGCCLTTGAYDHALVTLGFDPRERWRRVLRLSGKERGQELQQCRDMIRRSELSGLLAGLSEALQRIPDARERRWALRSSATNEDSAQRSAAGLYRTALGVPFHALGCGITDIWASVWTEQVIEYVLGFGAGDMPPSMAVVIQPMVDARIAGVAYSINPVTGRESHVTVNAVRGLGQSLVDGTVTPDQYVVDAPAGRPLRMIRYARGQQQERLVAAEAGIAHEPIPSVERDQSPLSDQQIFDIAAVTKRIERAFRGPVDVEWAIDRERLWILQARPVTAVQASSHPTTDDSEWSRANFKETMPELPSPMGLSFLEHFMDAYILSHYRRLGCRIPAGLDSVRIHCGRPYLNVTLFHLLVGQLGGDPALNAEQMGGEVIHSATHVQPLGWPALSRAGWIIWREMRRVLRASDVCFAEMKALAARNGREQVRQLSLMEVEARLDELNRWLEPHEMTFGIAAGTGQCLQAFSRLLPRWLGPDWRSLLNESLQGQGTVISAQQILRIADLVELARKDAKVSKALTGGWERGRYRERFHETAFLAAFDRYLEDYGHRAIGESDIMSRRLAEEPEALLQVIATQLEGPPRTADELLAGQRIARDRALETIRMRCGWRYDRWLIFCWWYRRLSRFFVLREANRHHLMWYSLAARHLLLRLGELLVERGVFMQKEDIFFLTLQEREALSQASREKWATLIEARRAEREHWSTVDVPDTLRGVEACQTMSYPPLADADALLRGLPVSSGISSGPVRFVRTATDWGRVRCGDILVAPVIDPGMAPLFGIAGGLIVEMGGTLSHGAIIAREYGLPAIANVTGAMSRLTEGERVTMDARHGIVRRHGNASGP